MELLVCVGSSCHLQNSREVIRCFKELIEKSKMQDTVELKGSFCMGHCADEGVCVKYGDKTYGVTPQTAEDFFRATVMKSK